MRLRFVDCVAAAHDDDDIGFVVLADDGSRYEFAITPRCLMTLLARGFQTAATMPVDQAQAGEGLSLPATMSLAVANLRPVLQLSSGPLALHVPIDAESLATLFRQVQAIEGDTTPRPQ